MSGRTRLDAEENRPRRKLAPKPVRPPTGAKEDGLWPTVRGVEVAHLVGVSLAAAESSWSPSDSLAELRQLAATAGARVTGSTIQSLRAPNPRSYLGAGKVAELAARQKEEGIDLFIFDDELSPSQARNLEQELGAKVIDRTGLVLDIFGQRAHTYEGRLQVQLAQYEYLLPRLAGQWTHLSRQEGGVGARGGPGETQLEIDRRRVRERIADIKRDLERVRRSRGLHRERRLDQSIAVVALVGYTNAGKSTLLNSVTSAGVLAEDKLFATLDPTNRRIRLPSGRQVILTDTVGFIQRLPPSVVAAFRATLEELDVADLLVHVVDASHPDSPAQAAEVAGVLGGLQLGEKPCVTVLNKIDRLTDAWPVSPVPEAIALAMREYPRPVPISAERGWGIADLLHEIDRALAEQLRAMRALLPYAEGALLNLWKSHGVVETEEYAEHGVLVAGRLPPALTHRFERYRQRDPAAQPRPTRRERASRA